MFDQAKEFEDWKEIKEKEFGCYCFEYKAEKDIERIAVQKMNNSLIVMVGKEDLAGLRLKYLNKSD